MKKILTVIFSFVSLAAFSQGEMTLPMMEHVYQSSYYIPTAVPDHKVSIGLPIISSFKVGFINTGFLPTTGFEKQNGVTVFNVNKFVNSMPSNNYLHIGNQIDFFHLRLKWRNSFLSFDAGNTTDINLNIPQSVFQFATFQWSEQGSEAGRLFDFSTLNTQILSYNHYSIGLNKMFKNFNIGGRFNLLQGIAAVNVYSDNLKIGVTSEAISLSSSATVNTSGINAISNDPSQLAAQFNNLGGSVDLGLSYKLRERFFLGFSASNIGFIDWKNDIENTKYSQSQTKGPFTGIDAFGPIIRGDSLENVDFADSLSTYFSTGTDTTAKRTSFRTWLTPRLYFSANYKVTNRFNVSAMLKLERYIEWRAALTLGAQYKFGRILSVILSSTYQYENITFGGGIVLKPGPFQIYVVSDNIFATRYNLEEFAGQKIPVALPYDAKMFNIRVGMNLVFGKILSPKKQSFNY
ncbi:MAG: DUF5723 family protein [Cytophagales bacterium]